MSRPAASGRARRAGAALLALCLTIALPARAQTARQSVRVGEVTAIAAPADLDLAVALAERADRIQSWYAVGRRSIGPLALVVVRGQSAFEAFSRGRIPAWGVGLTVPGARLVVIRADGDDPFRVLRHELAHVVLHEVVRGRVPLWFDEGYAAVAAGEIGRAESVRLNFAVAWGMVPTLTEVDAGLRGAQSTAELSYALAADAVGFLARKHPTRSLEPLIEQLGRGVPFDTAVALTTGLGPNRLDDSWRRDVKRRHSVVLWLAAGGMWGLVGLGFVVAALLRRRRDRLRRAALDVGWVVIADDPPVGSEPEQRLTDSESSCNLGPLDRTAL